MIEKSSLFFYRTRTPLHCGATESEGGIDLPVVRERITRFPLVPGTSLKGVWRSICDTDRSWTNEEVSAAFGSDSGAVDSQRHAGKLVFVDAHLLYLPVRCSSGPYLLLTCPSILGRFAEWQPQNGNGPTDWAELVETDSVLLDSSYNGVMAGEVHLEELEVKVAMKEGLKNLLPKQGVSEYSEERRAVVADDLFGWFCNYSLEIAAHNELRDNKTSKNLWFEEAVPIEAVFFAPVLASRGGTLFLQKLMAMKPPFFQVGGHESVGRGLMDISIDSQEKAHD